MQATAEKLVTLTTAADEQEAAMIGASLADQGIQSRTIGQFTAHFRAEAPGTIRVLVFASDLERAQNILQNLNGSDHSTATLSGESEVQISQSASSWNAIVRLIIVFWLALIGVSILFSAVQALWR